MKETNLTRQHSAAINRGLVDAAAARSYSWVEDMDNDTGADIPEGSVVVVLADGTIELAATVNEPRPTGVAMDTIDDGETGQVCFGGPVDLVLVTASVTAGEYGQTSTTPGQAQVAVGPSTAFCEFTSSGTTPSAFLWGGRGGGGIGGGGSGPGSGTPPWFNVTDAAYGATGDGTTDDTAAINAAIADINSAGCGVLYFPCGTYKVTSGLTAITVPCFVMGDGGHGQEDGSDSLSSIACTSQTAVVFTTTSPNVSFRDISGVNTFAGTPSAGAFIKATDSRRALYSGVYVLGFYDNIDIENSAGFGDSWRMTGCHIEGPVRYGLRMRATNTPDAGDCAISDSWFGTHSYDADAAIRIESGGGVKITNSKINMNAAASKRFAYGIDLAVANAVTTSVFLVSTMSIENIRTAGIHMTTTGSGEWGRMSLSNLQIGCYGSTGSYAIDIAAASSAKIYDVILDNITATGLVGHTVTAIRAQNVTTLQYGAIYTTNFTGVFTDAGGNVNIIDDTGSIAERVRITGTPSAGQVPVAVSSTSAPWTTPALSLSAPFATPAVVLGSAAAAGAATTVIRSDSTIVAFDATAPSTQAVGDAAATGAAAVAARRDHKHAITRPALDDLSDVVITSVVSGDRIRYDGSNFVNSALRWEPHVAYDGTVVLDGNGDPVMVEVN